MSSPAHKIYKNSDMSKLSSPYPPSAIASHLLHVNYFICLHILHTYIFFFICLSLDTHSYMYIYTHARSVIFTKKTDHKTYFSSSSFSLSTNTSWKSLHVYCASSHSFPFSGYIIFLCMTST